jgi:hypothetical protein
MGGVRDADSLIEISLSLHDQTVSLSIPKNFEGEVDVMLGAVRRDGSLPRVAVALHEQREDSFSITGAGDPAENLSREEALSFLLERVIQALIVDVTSAPMLHAGAVARNGQAVIVAGPTGAGKTSVTAWLIDRGFQYITDELVTLVNGDAQIVGLPRAMIVKGHGSECVRNLSTFNNAISVCVGADLAVGLPLNSVAKDVPTPCGLIVMPRYVEDGELRIESLGPAQAALQLMTCNLNARNLPDGGLNAITRLTRQALCITIEYGHFGQLDGVLDLLAHVVLDGDLDANAIRRLLVAFAPAEPGSVTRAQTYPIPMPTPRGPERKLTIGMATYDDYDGVYFSLQALRLYHPEILAETEFLVIDNHPDGPCSKPLKALEQSIPNYRYVPLNSRTGTAVRDGVFSEASGEFVLCIDCHIFFVSGAVRRLMDYFDTNRQTRDLLQGPMVHDDLGTISTHYHPAWRSGMYGYWEFDERGKDPNAEPFEIPMQGLGVFACPRSAWPGFNPRFRGFGGEEGYIHEKFRRAGGRVLCLPFLRWLHRFQRPMGLPYRNTWEDRVRNYVIGFRELGLPTTEMEAHFRELLGDAPVTRIFEDVAQEEG